MLALAVQAQRAPVFYDHDATVAFALRQHGVAYQQLSFHQSYEESIDLRSFSAAVRVQLQSGQVANGWVGCERGERQCFLELRSIGIRGERLPDISEGRPWPLRMWVESLLSGEVIRWPSAVPSAPGLPPATPTSVPPI
jgi:hypothetical protein